MRRSFINSVNRSPCPTSRLSGDDRCGLSLIDVTMTMLIIGVIAAVAAPRIGNTVAVYRVQASADRIAADLRLAQRHARTTGSSETVSFDVAGNRYTLSSVLASDAPNASYSVDLTKSPYEVTIVSATFDNAADITFDAYGGATDGGVVVVSKGGIQQEVEVDTASGRITVSERTGG